MLTLPEYHGILKPSRQIFTILPLPILYRLFCIFCNRKNNIFCKFVIQFIKKRQKSANIVLLHIKYSTDMPLRHLISAFLAKSLMIFLSTFRFLTVENLRLPQFAWAIFPFLENHFQLYAFSGKDSVTSSLICSIVIPSDFDMSSMETPFVNRFRAASSLASSLPRLNS